MSRVKFREPEILSRKLPDIEERLRIAKQREFKKFGKKIFIGDKPVNMPLRVMVPDPNDIARAKREGRKPRKVAKIINFGDLTLSISDKIEALTDVLKRGLGVTDKGRGLMIVQIGSLLKDTKKIKDMNRFQMITMLRGLRTEVVPSTPGEVKLPDTMKEDEYLERTAEVNVYIYANFSKPLGIFEYDDRKIDRGSQSVDDKLDLFHPIYQVTTVNRPTGLDVKVKRTTIGEIDRMKKGEEYFDLRFLSIVPEGFGFTEDGILLEIGEVEPEEEPEEPEEEGEAEMSRKELLQEIKRVNEVVFDLVVKEEAETGVKKSIAELKDDLKLAQSL